MTGRSSASHCRRQSQLCLALVIAGGAMAATWSAPIPLTSSGGGFGDGIDGSMGRGRSGPTSSGTVARTTSWSRGARRWARHGPPQTLSTDGYDSAVSAVGPYVDVVVEQNVASCTRAAETAV